MVTQLDVIMKRDLFGAWTGNGLFVCAGCMRNGPLHLDFPTENVISNDQVQGSGVFFYCAACLQRISPEQQ